jgi:hypothetical protein
MKSVDKKYFVFNKGINTEAPLVAWPEGFTIDEQNYDLLPDGSRRRRLGINHEAGGDRNFVTATACSVELDSGTRFYRWRNVNNDDRNNFIVAQIGYCIYVWNDPISGPLNTPIYSLDIMEFGVNWTDAADSEVSYAVDCELIDESTLSFAESEGKLIITGAHIEPLFVTLEEDGKLSGEVIRFTERDMFGIDDGISRLTSTSSRTKGTSTPLRT